VGAFVTVALAPAVVAVGLTVGFLVPLTLLPDAVGVIVRAIRLSARKRVGFIFNCGIAVREKVSYELA